MKYNGWVCCGPPVEAVPWDASINIWRNWLAKTGWWSWRRFGGLGQVLSPGKNEENEELVWLNSTTVVHLTPEQKNGSSSSTNSVPFLDYKN